MVKLGPMLGDSTVGDPEEVHLGPGQMLPGGGDSLELTSMRSRCSIAKHDPVALRDHVLDVDSDVRERSPRQDHRLLEPRLGPREAWDRRVVVCVVIGDQLVVSLSVALVEDLVDKASGDPFVSLLSRRLPLTR